MSTISIEEWVGMSPLDRRREIGNMTQAQATELYAAMESHREKGPRLNRNEWTALGYTGQQYLLGRIPEWESEILRTWGLAESSIATIPSENFEKLSDPAQEGWSRRQMYTLLLWSCLIPPLGLVFFLFNFWKPNRLAQSVILMGAGALVFCVFSPWLLSHASWLFDWLEPGAH